MTPSQRERKTPAKDATFWVTPVYSRNAYQELFYESLGVKSDRIRSAPTTTREMISSAVSGDVLHIHWPEGLWNGESVWVMLRRIEGLRRHLVALRRHGLTIIWTVHNLGRHDRKSAMDWIGYTILLSYSDLVLAHSQCVKDKLARLCGNRDKVVLVKHGLYETLQITEEFLNATCNKIDLVRSRKLVGCFGMVRPYKGFDIAVRATDILGSEYHCIVAGSFTEEAGHKPSDYVAENSTFHNEWIDEDSQAAMLTACDVVAMPYRSITTTGVLALAWAYGKKVVATPLPYFKEYAQRYGDGAIVLSDSDAPADFATAIECAISVSDRERRTAMSRIHQDLNWEECVRPLRAILRARGIQLQEPNKKSSAE